MTSKNNNNNNNELPFDDLYVKINNEIGENLGFLNVCIHFLFEIQEIKEFIFTEDFPYEYKYNIFQELNIIFERYHQLSKVIYIKKFPDNQRFINSIELKKEFSLLFNDSININNPIDIIFIFLNILHNFYLKLNDFIEINEDNNCDNKCLSHNLFFTFYVEQNECNNCGDLGDIFQISNIDYFYEINFEEFILKHKNKINFNEFYNKMFLLEKEKYSENINFKCSNQCKNNNFKIKNRILLNSNKYFILIIKYNKINNIKLLDLCKFMFMFQFVFNNKDLFTIYLNELEKKYFLNMIIFQKQKHFTILIYRPEKKNLFVYYDDMEIFEYESFDKFSEILIKNELIPILFFYKDLNSINLKKNIQLLTNNLNENDYNNYFNYCIDIDHEKKLIEGNVDLQKFKLRPQKEKLFKLDGNNLKELINKLEGKVQKNNSNIENDFLNKLKIVDSKLQTEENNENIDKNKEKKEDNLNKWICENCNAENTNKIYRCSICNYFNFDEYYKKNNKENNIENLIELNENKDDIKNDFSSSNYNENLCYDYTNYKVSDESPCWHCGHMNKYYKLKCKWCRFPINDSVIPKIIEIGNKMEKDLKNKLNPDGYFKDEYFIKENNKFKQVKMNRTLKEKNIYNNLSNKWKCYYCNFENLNTKFCYKCYKNRKIN